MYLGPMAAWSHTFFWVAHDPAPRGDDGRRAPPRPRCARSPWPSGRAVPRNRRRDRPGAARARGRGVVTNPILTWLLFAGVLLGAHFTAFYNWALTNHGGERPGRAADVPHRRAAVLPPAHRRRTCCRTGPPMPCACISLGTHDDPGGAHRRRHLLLARWSSTRPSTSSGPSASPRFPTSSCRARSCGRWSWSWTRSG